MARAPETHYAKGPGADIAYQVVGDGPMDLVVVPGWISHVDQLAADPGSITFIREFASFARVIQYDKLGTGASDPVVEVPTWRAVPTNCTLCWTPRAANVRHCSGSPRAGRSDANGVPCM